MNLTADIKQQPFKKTVKGNKSLFIKIETPGTSEQSLRSPKNFDKHTTQNINLIMRNIRQAKTRVVEGKLALDMSHRQQASPQKLVQSDRIGIVFNHNTIPKKVDLGKLALQSVEERCDDAEWGEGCIQLPLHFQSVKDNKGFNSNRNQFDSLNPDKEFLTVRQITGKQKEIEELLPRHRVAQAEGNKLKIKGKVEKQKQSLIDKFQSQFNHYRQRFARSKDFIRSKQTLNSSLQNKSSHRYKLQSYFLHQSHQKLPIYMQTDRSISKQKKILIESNKDRKIKITLNNPHSYQDSNNKILNHTQKQAKDNLNNGKFNLRPRYQIVIPNSKGNSNESMLDDKDQDRLNKGWLFLKRRIDKYDFVRKYLSQTDIFSIYQYLKRNHISQQRWPLFVVDQAYKKMSMKGERLKI